MSRFQSSKFGTSEIQIFEVLMQFIMRIMVIILITPAIALALDTVAF
jgi:hypothetical protein